MKDPLFAVTVRCGFEVLGVFMLTAQNRHACNLAVTPILEAEYPSWTSIQLSEMESPAWP